MRRVVLWTFVLLLGCACTRRTAYAQPDAPPLVTEYERAWLEAHAPIRVAFDGHFPPYSYFDAHGELQGFSVDVFALLEERLGVTFETAEQTTWAELFEAGKARDVDVIATVVHRPERTEWFAFTSPYVFKSLVVVARDGDERIRQRANLAGKTVALVRGYQYVNRILEEFPSVVPQFHDTIVDAMNAVATGQADATVTFLAAGDFLRRRHMMSNLRFAAVYDSEASNERIAVRSDWPLLASLLDRGLASISEAERRELEARWLPDPPVFDPPERVALTAAEQAWLDAHPVVRVGVDPEFHPFEFLEEGGHRGIAADYLALIGERVAIHFEVVNGLSWHEAVERAERGEIDVLGAVGRTREREAYLAYSEPYVSFHRVIVTRTDMPFISGVEELGGLRVAVQTNSSHEGWMRDVHPDVQAIGCPTLEACVRSVASGDVDALVGNVASLAHWIRHLNLTNLKVAGAASDAPHTLHVASRADWPELAALIQKGLDTITDEERAEIAQRWVVLTYEPAVDRAALWRVTIGAAVAVTFLGVWLLTLRRQKRAIAAARDEAVAANAALDALRQDLERQVEARTAAHVEAERKFQAAQKMEALGTLVGGIAHDFNNLLQGIIGTIFLVEEELEDEAHKRFLRDAAGLGERGAQLIQQLLAVARKGSANKATVDLRALMEELAPILRTTLPSTVRFDRDLGDEPLATLGNASLLQQVVLNLVNNARDAVIGSPEGRVALTLRRASDPLPAGLEQGEYALIEVVDNGPGMSPDVAEQVFEPFFTTKPEGKGTGLGLAMAFGAVQDHGGVIEVETAVGEGTHFRVFLPLGDTVSAAASGARSALHRGQGERILIADDEPSVRESHAAILTRLGYTVFTAEDGQEALDVLAQQRVELVVLDVLMPVMDGVSAGREIEAMWPDLPVVYVSAYDPDGDLPERLRPPGRPALTKPCTPHELSRVVRDALGAEPEG